MRWWWVGQLGWWQLEIGGGGEDGRRTKQMQSSIVNNELIS